MTELLRRLQEIHTLLATADDIYVTLPSNEQDKINRYHNENHNLGHCLRWGEQAAKELVRDIKLIEREE